MIKPYTSVRIDYISDELNISPADVQNLLVASILDEYVADATEGMCYVRHGSLIECVMHDEIFSVFGVRWTISTP